ncbi:SDR family NAD(P)-dependent oxidoreductase [Marinibacterium profundimaris]|uniref:Short-chain dehydrogenase n=1 Tax=Marinibacterium profundimaris TaxID=1679460 RepID=A0A225NBX2_9RHOB|nr:SDR family NAD(P)-dependent oxidoreductase [Marinibacterium profundimaris]OWU68343.1 short-chain dehydrogenase [Marinibacterium profundimaris]
MDDTITGLFGLSGRVAFVTGAGSGLGRVIAETLAGAGAHVVVADLDGAAAEVSADGLRQRGLSAEALALDVSETGACDDAVGGILKAHGRLDIAFANAGISGGPGPGVSEGMLAAISRERWASVLDVNLTGVAETLRAVAEPMKAQGRGRIVAVASASGMRSDPMVSYAYAAAKAGVINLVRQAAAELAPHNVMANVLAPGPFLTSIGKGRLHDPTVAACFAETTMAGRVAAPNEIAGAALLLASDASSFMAGSILAVDGGASAW